MKITFERKPDFQFRDFIIEKNIHLPAGQFEQMLRKPLTDQPFLADNIDLMRQDDKGVYHCLLVTGEGHSDGLLVESEGHSYARYAAYVPEVADLEIGDDFEVTYHPGYCPHYVKQEEDEAGGIIPQ